MKHFSLFFILQTALSFSVAAQTLTESSFPVAGDVFINTLADTTGFNSGASGMNATWNFSGLTATGATLVDSFLSPAATPYAAVVTNATVAVHTVSPAGSQYIYYQDNTSTGAFQRIANIIPDTVIYSVQGNEFQYPLSYGTNVTGNYYALYHGSGGMNVEAGTVSGSADGTGTLTTPFGTYSNVLRVHAMRNENDTIDNGAVAGTTIVEYYNWYQANSYFPILSYNFTSTSVMGHVVHSARTLSYRRGYVTAINEVNNTATKLQLYPNPTNQKTTLFISNPESGPIEICITDLAGRQLYAEVIANNNNYNFPKELNLENLVAGIYLVTVKGNSETATQKLQINR